jgi:hypothetical protein
VTGVKPRLEDCLRDYGLFVRGVTRLTEAELENWGFEQDKPWLALVGNIGSSYWPNFSQAWEFHDGESDPLDRWSRRVAEALADELSLRPVYPFSGPPYYPFQQWAQRAEALEQSPIGVMMHPQFGLWHSYRFALLGAGFDYEETPQAAASPCQDCDSQPCLRRCPVDAFDANGYAVERCAAYLQQTPQAECHRQGCLARYACPVAPELRYVAAQGEFHLRAFLHAR